jgi:hypothetical protein
MPDPTPDRLEQLLAGAEPADGDERGTLRLMAELRAASAPVPVDLRRRVRQLASEEPASARTGRLAVVAPTTAHPFGPARSARGRLAGLLSRPLGPALAAAFAALAALAVVLALSNGGNEAEPGRQAAAPPPGSGAEPGATRAGDREAAPRRERTEQSAGRGRREQRLETALVPPHAPAPLAPAPPASSPCGAGGSSAGPAQAEPQPGDPAEPQPGDPAEPQPVQPPEGAQPPVGPPAPAPPPSGGGGGEAPAPQPESGGGGDDAGEQQTESIERGGARGGPGRGDC